MSLIRRFHCTQDVHCCEAQLHLSLHVDMFVGFCPFSCCVLCRVSKKMVANDNTLSELVDVLTINGVLLPTVTYIKYQHTIVCLCWCLSCSIGTGRGNKELRTGRRAHPGSDRSPRQLQASQRLHQSEKAGPSHKTCIHCSGSIARNAVMCKWCFEPVSRSSNRHT